MTDKELYDLIENWENMVFFLQQAPSHPEYFDEMLELALNSNDKKSWRAAWVADKIHDIQPELFIPYIDTVMGKLKDLKDLSKKRHYLKLLSMHDLPEEYFGFLVDYCLNTMSSEEPPAVRVYAMQILYNISLKEPDLKSELISTIEQEIEYRSTPGIQSRGRHLLKKLRK